MYDHWKGMRRWSCNDDSELQISDLFSGCSIARSKGRFIQKFMSEARRTIPIDEKIKNQKEIVFSLKDKSFLKALVGEWDDEDWYL